MIRSGIERMFPAHSHWNMGEQTWRGRLAALSFNCWKRASAFVVGLFQAEGSNQAQGDRELASSEPVAENLTSRVHEMTAQRSSSAADGLHEDGSPLTPLRERLSALREILARVEQQLGTFNSKSGLTRGEVERLRLLGMIRAQRWNVDSLLLALEEADPWLFERLSNLLEGSSFAPKSDEEQYLHESWMALKLLRGQIRTLGAEIARREVLASRGAGDDGRLSASGAGRRRSVRFAVLDEGASQEV